MSGASGSRARRWHRSRRALACAVAYAVLSCTSSTGVDGGPNAGVASVSVDPPSSTLVVGSDTPLHVAVRDADGNALSGASIVWTVRDANIATVSDGGVVTGRSVGSTQVAANVAGRSGVAAVTVTPVPVASVVVKPGTASLIVGESTTLVATPQDAAGAPLADRIVTWTTSAASVATVSGSGVVTAVGPGTATITALSEGKTGTTAVTVAAVPVASVIVEPASATLFVGQVAPLTATVKDAAGNVLVGRAVAWVSTNALVAAVTPGEGVVTGVAPGSVTISATVDGKSGSAAVVVTAVPVASVAVQPKAPTLVVGGSVTLGVVVTDANGAVTSRAVAWKTNNSAVATVSSAGVVSAVAPGSATITAESEGKSDGALVTVTRAPVASVSVQPTAAALVVGATVTLASTVTDTRGVVVSDRVVAWSSSNDAVASVSATGIVTALAPGSATITATSEGRSGSAVIGVSVIPVASVTVQPPAVNLFVAQTTVLTAVVKDATGAVVNDRPITWTSGDQTVATVSATGVVTAVAPGSTTITAAAGGRSGSSAVVVTLVPVGSVSIAPTTKSMQVGTTTTLVPTVRDANGTIVTNRSLAWTTSDPLVATVSSAGVVTAVAVGPATITATSEGKSGSSAITVIPVPVASVTVQPPAIALQVGQTATATAITKDASGNVLTGRVVTWISNNTSVATVSGTGVITAVAPGGPVFVTASSEGWNGSTSVTVTAVPVATVSLPATATLVAGQSTTLVPVVKDANGLVVTDRVVTWSSSNTSVATVSSAGVVKSLITGTATITATSETKSGSTTLTVTPAAVGTVTVAPLTTTIASGSTGTLVPTVKDINGTTVTDRIVTWSSSDELVATVSSSGVVTARATGSAIIRATSETKFGTATVTVVPGPAAVVTVTPATGSVRDGQNLQLTATATDANGNAITGRSFIWTSSNTNVATVTSTGLVRSKTTGTTTITAKLDAASDTSLITVTP